MKTRRGREEEEAIMVSKGEEWKWERKRSGISKSGRQGYGVGEAAGYGENV